MTNRNWLSELPSGWRAQRADAVLDYRKTPARTTEFELVEVFHYSIPAIQETGDGVAQNGSEIESDKIRLDGGELIVSKLNPRKGCVLLTQTQSLPIVCSTEFVPLVPRPGFDARFAFYVFSSTPIREWISAVVHSATRSHQRASPEDITKIWIPVPPLAKQRAIADYLDRETARLDALVAAKQRLLGLLAEKRRALITRAVTRGLDPRAPLRDSGIPWLGEIPAHWAVKRLKFHLRSLEQGWSPMCDNTPADLEEWGVLKTGCVNGGEFDPAEHKRLPDSVEPLSQYEVREGDVLMSRANTTSLLGSTALVGAVRSRLLLCDKLYRLGVDDQTMCKGYFVAFLRTPPGRYEFERDATGASNSMQNIGQDSVSNLWLPVPPIDEQREIVSRIATESGRLDHMQVATERTLRLLKERRSALIAAAVTGRLPIPPPSAGPDPAPEDRPC